MKKLMVFFAAGCMGGLAYGIIMWGFGEYGITRSAGVSMAPTLKAAWLYPKIVWGGIWGLLFLLPLYKSNIFLKGLVLGLIPAAIQLFVIYPYHTRSGTAGLGLGTLTPLFVIFYNWIWAMGAAMAIRFAK